MSSRSRNRLEVDVDHVEALSHTQGYDVDEYLVTRRGTTFPVNLKSRAKVTVESASLVYNNQHQVSLKLGKQSTPTTIEVTVPADAPVTVYTLNVKGKFVGGGSFDANLAQHVVVLFNPWCQDDTVYMENPEWRNEYVLNTQGVVYAGDLDGTPWNLGLHRPDSLRAAIFLIEKKSDLSFDQKSSPVLISREMSALINSVDDSGVLVGRWDGNYYDGRSPSSWRGSGQILQQFYRSGGEPVKYGQCWVFSGVLMSVLRLLGIPSRSVTNFSSAHDTNCNRSIDNYYNEDGEKVSYLSTGSDSIWNFHVWNEAYMARPDLPGGYDGWQALDATPQEESPQGGGYKTGPAPLKAIKDGNSVDYDANFIISEVNADVKKYIVGKDGEPRLCRVDTSLVGRDISTKAIGNNGREDITHHYKYGEGTEKERRSLLRGIAPPVEEPEEVVFEIPQSNLHFGENVVFVVKATSKERQHRVKGLIQCEAIAYTGRLLKEVAKLKVDKKLSRGRTEVIQMTVGGDIFSEFSGTKVYLRFNVTLPVVGTRQVFAETVTVSPTPPKLSVSGPDTVGLGQEATISCTFTNPLPVAMHDVVFNVDADDLLEEDIVHPVGTLNPKAELTCAFEVTGLKVGTHSIVVGLDSDKTEMVTAKKEITVEREGPPPVEPPFRPIGDINKIEVDTIYLNLEQNRLAHHTDRYDYEGLIVRRGQRFTLSLTLTNPLPTGAKVVTRAVFKLLSKKLSRPYTFEVEALSFGDGNTLELDLTAPANVAIGEYELLLNFDNKGTTTSFNGKIKLALLFNPWCREDSCHYSNVDHLEEYVLNNRGRIWKGSARSSYGAPWQFAQFKKDTLEVTFYIMDQLSVEKRKDPVEVSRHLSALANSSDDDNGILVGNWSGNYSGGTAPTDWTGSAEIMAEYNQTKRSVCFGQCWVFSGVMTTMFRCLGIPARSVTNFNSAHDTDANRSIDRYFDESGDRIPHSDSLWNFHVWNEAYMARPDLPAGFGGWQVLDATPQEESPQGGGFRLGPCPQRAVKLGQRMNYDTDFVISEVNADLCYYTLHSDGSRSLDKVYTALIGKNISTKAIGSRERQDLTDDYKFREGSAAERAALLAETEAEKQIGVELTLDDEVVIGEDFVVKATITNKGNTAKEFLANLHGRAVLYTGAPGQVIKSLKNISINLDAGESKTIELPVKDSDYLRILEGGNLIDFVAMVAHPADRLSVIDSDTLRLKTPDIAISLPEGGLKLYQPATINVSFTNPLSKRLSGGKFTLHGEGYLNDVTVDVSSVGPNRIASASLQTIPVKTGPFELVVRFSSNQLTDILGDEDVEVVAT